MRAVEALVQMPAIGVEGPTGTACPREKDPDTRAFEKELSDALGLRVEIKRGSGESGNLVIKFGNFDQLDYIRRLSASEARRPTEGREAAYRAVRASSALNRARFLHPCPPAAV